MTPPPLDASMAFYHLALQGLRLGPVGIVLGKTFFFDCQLNSDTPPIALNIGMLPIPSQFKPFDNAQ